MALALQNGRQNRCLWRLEKSPMRNLCSIAIWLTLLAVVAFCILGDVVLARSNAGDYPWAARLISVGFLFGCLLGGGWLIFRHPPSPMRKLWRIVVGVTLLPVVAFCIFGFMASGEAGADAWAFRLFYGVVGCGCLLGGGWLIFRHSPPPPPIQS